ncbi:cystathionine beta-lyase [Parvularcula marina]|uniref:Cystathionine beta-lyase n=1 Tax=Parvularcula marina TaxID=2292771 RepID=A0A371RF99_9PROT|nr:cystathionine beta-lyase [Parvularcula marina]RFB04100.1 cystathionine beta-lyase [Parvularcula marina]
MKGPTKDAHKGRPAEGVRMVNPAVECGSTVLFPDYASFRAQNRPWHYGRMGTPTHKALEESLGELEGAEHVSLTGSGLAACTLAILSVVKEGGHLLVTDSAYEPTRAFCDIYLKSLGIETTYFDPHADEAAIRELVRPNTQGIFCESPGSLTFEVQDIPAIVRGAGDIPVIVDNTYGAGVHYKPLELGAAISLQALTKYVGGHSDLLMGAVITRKDLATAVQRTARVLGISVSGKDASLAHRGLRTLHRRLDVHEASGLAVARWLEDRPEIASVLHPGLESHPGHALWARDGTGTNGLFSVIADWEDEATTGRFIDALHYFGLGYSWGGYESLCLPAWPAKVRSAVPWTETRQLLRFHIGLEDVSDLTTDLKNAFDMLKR